ncbi:hypothetical protein [Luteimonas sp. A501]
MSGTSEAEFYLIDVDGNRRVPFKQRNRADGRFGYSILPSGKGNDPSTGEYTEDVARLIQRVVLDGQLVRAKVVGGNKDGQVNSVGVERRVIRGYWVAPSLRHLIEGGGGALANPVHEFDAEARVFLDGFLAADNPQFVHWLPRYRETLRVVGETLERETPEAVFDLIWKSVDNAVSNAGQGVLGFDAADRSRHALVQVIREIGGDGSAAQFDQLMARLERWKQAGELPKVPRLMLARAFSAIHPDRYHTTVDVAKQDRLLPWFEAHSGFVAPPGNWAVRAEALTRHLDRCGVFDGDRELRNMFPWYVFEQLRDASGKLLFRPGHTPRPPIGQARGTGGTRSIEYRHNVIQDALVALLRERHGEDAVASEHSTGTGGRADVLVRRADGRYELYEIKPAATAADAVRQALGQLLEYAYRRGGLEPAALHVVSNAILDEGTSRYLSRLQSGFGLPVNYLQMACNTEGA